jgi:hypothetical protein
MKVLGASVLLIALWSIAEPIGADPFHGNLQCRSAVHDNSDYATIPRRLP